MAPGKQVRINSVSEAAEDKGNEGETKKGDEGGYVLSEEEMKNRGDDLTPEEKRIHEKYKKDPSCADHFLFSPKLRIVYVIIFCITLGLVIPFLVISYSFEGPEPYEVIGECLINTSYRFPCKDTEDSSNSDECLSLGCCYDDSYYGTNPYVPRCYHSFPSVYGYKAPNGKEQLSKYRLSNGTSININLISTKKTTLYNTTAWNITLRVWRESEDIIRIYLNSPGNDEDIPFLEPSHNETFANYSLDVVAETDQESLFFLTVFRIPENDEDDIVKIFETEFGPLQYGEGYIEITAKVPSKYVYGMGPKDFPYLVPDFSKREKWTLMARETEGSQGSFPFYFLRENSGKFHAVFFQNGAPMEFGVLPSPSVIFRSLRGAIDLRFFGGPSPRDVSKQLTSVVGKPALPPYWALGFHVCRSVDEKDQVSISRTIRGDMDDEFIPYESDCINGRLTYPDSFQSLPDDIVEEIMNIKQDGRKFILVGHPFLEAEGNVYDRAVDADVLVKLNENTSYFGSINQKSIAYPDFVSDRTFLDWLSSDDEVLGRYELADGVLLFRNSPLNEASINFTFPSDGSLKNCSSEAPDLCCSPDGLSFRPSGSFLDVSEDTICGEALHLDGGASHTSVHNFYGASQALTIDRLLSKIKVINASSSLGRTRNFVTSSSLFPGFSGGFLPEGYGPNFVSQQIALSNVLGIGLSGYPLSGTPLCGSKDDEATESLNLEWCLRAYQNGALLPLSFSYYEEGQTPRNPSVSASYNFTVQFIHNLRTFIRFRYLFLPYLYTLFYESSLNGIPVARPLFYEFPDDEGSLEVSSQFMAGSALLVSPVLASQKDSTSSYVLAHFPPSCWYDFYTGMLFTNDTTQSSDHILSVLSSELKLHVRGGFMVPLQGSIDDDDLVTTREWRSTAFTFIVAFPCVNSSTFNQTVLSSGYIYLDDGETDPDSVQDWSKVEVKGNWSGISVVREGSFCGAPAQSSNFSTTLGTVRVFGGPLILTDSIEVNGVRQGEATQNEDTGTINIEELNTDWCEEDIVITWELL